MKAIEKLIELRKEDPSIVAIAKDENSKVHLFRNEIPYANFNIFEWWSSTLNCTQLFCDIDFGTTLWTQCIVIYKDLEYIESYEVKTMSISVQDYERLVNAEKTLKKIQKFFV